MEDEDKKEYIDIHVAKYALPQVCEALYRNGVQDLCVTQEDGELHIRWEFKPGRYAPRAFQYRENNGTMPPEDDPHLIDVTGRFPSPKNK